MPTPDRELVHVTSRAEWREWLSRNHSTSPGIWLVTHTRRSGLPAPSYDDIVEEALCFGWIDSTVGKVDDTRARQLLTPRKPRSTWSAVNKERLSRLLPAGLVAPPGLAAIEIAKANGSWESLDAVERLEVPDDLKAALAEHPTARAKFDAFSASSRKIILWWIASARRPETRAARVTRTAELAEQGLRANHPESKGR